MKNEQLVRTVELGTTLIPLSKSAGFADAEQSLRRPVRLPIEDLLRTRLLVQASSGGGKSWLLRRLIEQLRAAGTQVLVLDPEDEFASLREKYEFVVCGQSPDCDAEASPEVAGALATRLLEHGASAVLGLFDLTPMRRKLFVKNFLDAMTDAPKSLWRDVVVVLDEAHLFAPEKGHGESCASEAVMSMATRGRKRGFCLVPATQRLSKLDKDVAAECNNVLIGQTTLDLDRARAADALGFSGDKKKDFFAALRSLEPGQFYGIGRAISQETIRIRVGNVETAHPEPGSKYSVPARPPGLMSEMLASLRDLPRVVAEEKETVASLRAEVSRLQKELHAKAYVAPAAPQVRTVEVDRVPAGLHNAIENLRERMTRYHSIANALTDANAELYQTFDGILYEASKKPAVPIDTETRDNVIPYTQSDAKETLKAASRHASADDVVPTGTALRILQTMAAHYPKVLSMQQVATLIGISHKTGTYSEYIKALRGRGLITEDRPPTITNKGLDAAGPVEAPKTSRELLLLWSTKLQRRESEMLEIFASSKVPLTHAQVAKIMGISPQTGTFSEYIKKLQGNCLIRKTRGGREIVPELAL